MKNILDTDFSDLPADAVCFIAGFRLPTAAASAMADFIRGNLHEIPGALKSIFRDLESWRGEFMGRKYAGASWGAALQWEVMRRLEPTYHGDENHPAFRSFTDAFHRARRQATGK